MEVSFPGGPPAAATRFVVERVAWLFAQRMREGPSRGPKPLQVVQGAEPQTLVGSLPGAYTIALTCLESERLNQVAYQVGHELFHVFSDPCCIHPWMEVLACATSLATLTWMGTGQSGCLRVPPLMQRYEAKYRDYYARILDSAFLHVFGVSEEKTHPETVRSWAKTFEMGCDDRNQQLVAARLIEHYLNQQDIWTAFRLSYTCVESNIFSQQTGWRESVSGEKWISACALSIDCPPGHVDIVRHICHLFGILDRKKEQSPSTSSCTEN